LTEICSLPDDVRFGGGDHLVQLVDLSDTSGTSRVERPLTQRRDGIRRCLPLPDADSEPHFLGTDDRVVVSQLDGHACLALAVHAAQVHPTVHGNRKITSVFLGGGFCLPGSGLITALPPGTALF
jgi:hypothetical protein